MLSPLRVPLPAAAHFPPPSPMISILLGTLGRAAGCAVRRTHGSVHWAQSPVFLWQCGGQERVRQEQGSVAPSPPCGGCVSLSTQPAWKQRVETHTQLRLIVNSLSLECRKPVGPQLALVGLIFPLDLRTFGPPGVSCWLSCCVPCVGRVMKRDRTVGRRLCFPPWRCNQLGKRPRTRSRSPSPRLGLLHPETPLRLAFIYFNLVDRHQTLKWSCSWKGGIPQCFNLLHPPPAKEATGLLFPPSAPWKRACVQVVPDTRRRLLSRAPGMAWLGA